MYSNLKNTKCIFAYGGITVRAHGGIKPCCHMVGTGVSNKQPIWDREYTDSNWLNNLKDNLNNGIKDKQCIKCWDLEKSGLDSARTGLGNRLYNAGLITEQPWSYVDLCLGSKCNLMCTMCTGSSSSLIAKEQWENKEEDWPEYKDQSFNNNYKLGGWTDKLQWWENPKFYELIKLNAEHIRTLKFTGGEPTTIPNVHKLMRWMIKSGHSKHIDICITTNGTYKGTDIYETMCEFKSANLTFSVEGTEDVYNYIRYPHTWKRWTRNIKNAQVYRGEIKIRYQVTVSPFNLFNIKELAIWLNEEGGVKHSENSYRGRKYHHNQNPNFEGGVKHNQNSYHENFVNNPKYHDIRYLPRDTLERAIEYLKDGDRVLCSRTTKFITGRPDISEIELKTVQYELKRDTLIKDKLRTKRSNYDSIDNNKLRLKDLFSKMPN